MHDKELLSSEGVGIGIVVIIRKPELKIEKIIAEDLALEIKVLKDALTVTKQQFIQLENVTK